MIFFQPSLILPPGSEPLTHARIGWDRIPQILSVTSAAAGFPGVALNNPLTYESWKPAAMPATATWDAGFSRQVDYVGIAAHTLGTSASTVIVEHSPNNSTWTTVMSGAPPDNEAVLFIFATITARYWRIRITGATAPNVGVVFIGKLLEMQRPIYGGHSPITLSRQTVIRPNISETGQWLGRTKIRKGYASSAEWRHLKADWYRDNFDPFAEYATQGEGPFFFAWRPITEPSEVAYCWTAQDIRPSNMGIRDYMSVGLSMEGFSV